MRRARGALGVLAVAGGIGFAFHGAPTRADVVDTGAVGPFTLSPTNTLLWISFFGQPGSRTIDGGSRVDAYQGVVLATLAGPSGELRVTGAGSELVLAGGGILGTPIVSTNLLEIGAEGTGLVSIDAGGQIRVDSEDRLGGGALLGTLPGSAGHLVVDGADSQLRVLGTNGARLEVAREGSGLVEIASGGRVEAPVAVVGTTAGGVGEIRLAGGVLAAPEVVLGAGGTLAGEGDVEGSLEVLGGAVRPEERLHLTGSLALGCATQAPAECPGGLLALRVASASAFDRLAVDGLARLLAGSLEIEFVGGFVPPPGAQIPLFELAPGASLEIDPALALVFAGVPPAVAGQLSLGPDGVLERAAPDTDGDGVADPLDNCTLVPNANQRDTNQDGFGNLCDSDFDGNRFVNTLDLAYFRSRFLTADPHADLDGSGVVNLLDLQRFRAQFFKPPGPSGLVP